MKKWLAFAALLAVIAGVSYGLFMDWRLRKTLWSKDSLLLVTDSLHRQSDSLLHLSRQRDTVWLDSLVPHLIHHWDTVKVGEIVYVPIQQADSVKDQRDLCLVNYQLCRQARDKAADSRDAALAANSKLREQIARDSLKDHSPHLNLSAVLGPGVIKPFGKSEVQAGIGAIVGIRLYNLRIF